MSDVVYAPGDLARSLTWTHPGRRVLVLSHYSSAEWKSELVRVAPINNLCESYTVSPHNLRLLQRAPE